MCNVCDASTALDLSRRGVPATMAWGIGHSIEVEAESEGAEFKPARFRFRRPKEAWTPWQQSDDLAGSLGALGTDVKWEFVPEPMRRWVVGTGPLSAVLALLT